MIELLLAVSAIWLVFWLMVAAGVFHPIWRRKNPRTASRIGYAGLFVFLMTGFLISVPRVPEPVLQVWNIYRGEVGEYSVEIDESNYGRGLKRIVHLYPKGAPSWVSITGHDYNDDKEWDRVFRSGYPEQSNGANAVLHTRSGWKWEPCPADKDRVKPFTEEEIDFAIGELDKAMAEVYNIEHRVSTLEEWREKHS